MPTATQDFKTKASMLMQDVCELLQWNEQQYSEWMHSQGIAYLMLYLPCDDANRKALEASKAYWGWFKTKYMLLDEVFVNTMTYNPVSVEAMTVCYKNTNAGWAMIQDMKPPTTVTDILFKKQAA